MTQTARTTLRKTLMMAGALSIMSILAPGATAHADSPGSFHYDAESVKPATYYAALSNLANAVMFSGLGEKLIFSPYERDDWLRRAGYVTRPPMPDMGIVGVLYRAAKPEFAGRPDFAKPETLRWKTGSFDRTLDPGVQAWALLKITSPEFHLQFHDLPENKIAALMMLPQARTMAKALMSRLRNSQGLFAPRMADGRFGSPKPRDQAAVLWAAASFKLAATSTRTDYWHQAYRDLTQPAQAAQLADQAFAAMQKLPPTRAGDRAIAIAALGRYALITKDDAAKAKALAQIRQYAKALQSLEAQPSLSDIALSIFGLTEAGRILQDQGLIELAAERYQAQLMPLWQPDLAVFRNAKDAGTIAYTPKTAGAVVAALNAMRWYGPAKTKAQAAKLYPRFFEGAIIRSGLLRGSPLGLVSKKYRKQHPAAHFAHPILPRPEQTGIAPVFAGEVRFDKGQWRMTDPLFRTGPAMFLSHMLAIKSADGRDDIFIAEALLKRLGA